MEPIWSYRYVQVLISMPSINWVSNKALTR